MKKYFVFTFLILLNFLSNSQTKDSIKITKDSVKIKTDSIQVVIDSLEIAKDSIKIKADTIKYWKQGGLAGINATQSSFTNWAAGGENTVSATAYINVFLRYKKNKSNWDNTLDMAYGLIQTAHSAPQKNEDKIDLMSKFGYYAFFNRWYYTALLNCKTQFDDGYNYPDDSNVVSHFFAPASIIGAIGLDYKSKDNSFSFFFSAITSKTTIVYNQKLADQGAYGVEPAKYDTVAGVISISKRGEFSRSEFGGYMNVSFKKDIMKNVNLETKLELFSNYIDNPQNVDLNWELFLRMKVNKFITASINTQMIYDHDIPIHVKRKVNGVEITETGPRLQFKEVIALGLAFKF